MSVGALEVVAGERTATAGPSQRERRRLTVRGIVQGVGFRPTVWNLAKRHDLAGSVRNTSGGVVIEVEGPPDELDAFAAAVVSEAPALARIDSFESVRIQPLGDEGFRIVESQPLPGQHQPLSPDAATCEACLRELFTPGDRRHLHPFINCTNCGPRFTIIEDIPYDRPLTTMRRFEMCDRCRQEYEDPGDRRFHAQPIACPDCGPRLWFSTTPGQEVPGEPIALASEAIARGETVAVKGLGGFQLACDATDERAVRRLRERKHRPSKPFAVMVSDMADVRALCEVSQEEAAALTSPARPIVLLKTRRTPLPGGDDAAAPTQLAPSIAPGLDEVGLMLPYTPVHHLLMRSTGRPLVMTSGNLSEEPIAKDNDEALHRLSAIADAFLLHDRDIYARYDDSVVKVIEGTLHVVRRARGLCPLPIHLEGAPEGGLALGAHLKNTFCIVKREEAFLGPHIGELDDPLSLSHQGEALTTYLRLFRAHPGTIACDLHPDYASTRLAEEWADDNRELVRVQHHHAHIASVMAEHGLRGQLIGVAFDGTGYGPDGTVWGGEFLLCDERDFARPAHLLPVRQPGGDLCAREGWRMAASYLLAAGLPVEAPEDLDERRWRLVCRLAASELPPLSSSAGRLFDAAASLLGAGHVSSFEAEAAMRLEGMASWWLRERARGRPIDAATASTYTVPVSEGSTLCVDTTALIRHLIADRDDGRPAAELAYLFHESLAQAIGTVCTRLREASGANRVALSGGVFQNALLLTRTGMLLKGQGFDVYSNRTVPANDGGISLGQALIASMRSPHPGGPR
ncbi:MAG TPA: carbamoyltransferase HypF [Candidatus Sulfotelmatobacter sp.]|nr:carbamoyltransferase HypF [Candidatus Sulfotelmatobacter sp.]